MLLCLFSLSFAAAIAKRVALVVLAGIALGVALFFLGLEYMFPKLD